MNYTNMECPECGKQRTMLPEWSACGICRDEGEELPAGYHARRNNPFRNFTEEQVRAIRASDASTSMLAIRLGADFKSVWNARNGKTYRWVA